MNEDGTMARLPELLKVAEKFDIKIVSIEDLVAYRMEHDSLIEKKEDFQLETRFGEFRVKSLSTDNEQSSTFGLNKRNLVQRRAHFNTCKFYPSKQ